MTRDKIKSVLEDYLDAGEAEGVTNEIMHYVNKSNRRRMAWTAFGTFVLTVLFFIIGSK